MAGLISGKLTLGVGWLAIKMRIIGEEFLKSWNLDELWRRDKEAKRRFLEQAQSKKFHNAKPKSNKVPQQIDK